MTDGQDQRQERADLALREFWRRVERGEAPSVAEMLEEHIELRDLLEPRLEGYRALRSDVGKVSPGDSGLAVRYIGDYELVEEVGRGGMGIVYRARQVSLSRDVAIKMIVGGQLAGDDAIQRFRMEAEAAANLKHPNIVAIHEIGEHEGHQYFSMDYVEGTDLAQLVRENALPARDAAELVQTIAEAIHYAMSKARCTGT